MVDYSDLKWLLCNDFLIFLISLQAAKETGALQAAKTMLEKQVEELTCQLQLEKRMRVITTYNKCIISYSSCQYSFVRSTLIQA